MKKRLFSGLMVLCMLLTLFPVPAQGTDSGTVSTSVVTESTSVSVVTETVSASDMETRKAEAAQNIHDANSTPVPIADTAQTPEPVEDTAAQTPESSVESTVQLPEESPMQGSEESPAQLPEESPAAEPAVESPTADAVTEGESVLKELL